MRVKTPHEQQAYDLKRVQSVNQKRKIEDVIQAFSLPAGMCFVNGLILDQSSWLCYILATRRHDPTRCFVKGLRFGWLTESASPSHIQERIEAAILDFQKEIAEGTAQEVKDGDLIADDCIFFPKTEAPIK